MNAPITFKVRTKGKCSGINGGKLSDGTSGGHGILYYENKTFTLATHQDQYLLAPTINNNMYKYFTPKSVTSPNKINYLSVFSGIEACTVAWHHMGWTPVGFSEIDLFASSVLSHHYPNINNYGDITKYKEWPIQRGSVKLLAGGSPCQSFSVAGLRKGIEDPRGNLALTFLGLADHLQPEYILWENVPGVLSSNKGEDFASFISALAQIGYGFAWRVFNAEHFGVPQRRKRLYLFAIRGTGNWRSAGKVLFNSHSLSGYSETRQEKCKENTSTTGEGTNYSSTNYTIGEVAGTLDAHYYKGQGSRAGGEREYIGNSNNRVRRLTPMESERLQGFPDNYTQVSWKGKPPSECPDSLRYKACGNSMAVPVMRWIGESIQMLEDNKL